MEGQKDIAIYRVADSWQKQAVGIIVALSASSLLYHSRLSLCSLAALNVDIFLFFPMFTSLSVIDFICHAYLKLH